jgi:hypothetical protein
MRGESGVDENEYNHSCPVQGAKASEGAEDGGFLEKV